MDPGFPLFPPLSDLADHSFGISEPNIATNNCFEWYQFYVFMGLGGTALYDNICIIIEFAGLPNFITESNVF